MNYTKVTRGVPERIVFSLATLVSFAGPRGDRFSLSDARKRNLGSIRQTPTIFLSKGLLSVMLRRPSLSTPGPKSSRSSRGRDCHGLVLPRCTTSHA